MLPRSVTEANRVMYETGKLTKLKGSFGDTCIGRCLPRNKRLFERTTQNP